MLNLGLLQFALEVNTRALGAAAERIRNFGREVDLVQQRANRGVDTNIAALRRQENAILSAGQNLASLISRIQGARIDPQIKTEMIERAGRIYNGFSKQMADSLKELDNTKFDRTVQRWRAALGDLHREVARAPKFELIDNQAEARNLARLARLRQELQEFNTRVGIQPSGYRPKSAQASAAVFEARNSARDTEAWAAAQARVNNALTQGEAYQMKSARASAAVFREATAAAAAEERLAQRRAAANERVAATLFQVEQRARNVNALIDRSPINIQASTGLTDRMDAALNRFRAAVAGGGDMGKAQIAALRREFTAAANEIQRDALKIKSSVDKVPESFEIWRRNLRGVGSGVLLLNGHLGGLSTRVFALGSVIGQFGVLAGVAAGGVAGLTVAIAGLGRGAVQTAMLFEKIDQGLQAITGSSEAAAVQMDFVRQITNQAGLELEGTARAYTRYLAGANAAGQSTSETQRQFTSVALAAAKLQLSVQDTEGVFRALEQIMSKGTVQSEELRGQLGDRLPGAFAIAARAMNMTTRELQDMMKKGEVISRDFVPLFVDALTQQYNINITEDINTLQASLNRATTATQEFFLAFDEATGVSTAAKNALNAFASVLTALTNSMGAITIELRAAAVAILAMVAAYGAWRLASVIVTAQMASQLTMMGLMRLGWAGLLSGMTALISPAGALAAVIGLIGVVSYVSYRNHLLAADGISHLRGETDAATVAYRDLYDRQKEVYEAQQAQADAMRDAAAAMPGLRQEVNALGREYDYLTDSATRARAAIALAEREKAWSRLNAAREARDAMQRAVPLERYGGGGMFAPPSGIAVGLSHAQEELDAATEHFNIAYRAANEAVRRPVIEGASDTAPSSAAAASSGGRSRAAREVQADISAIEALISEYQTAKEKIARLGPVAAGTEGFSLQMFDVENVEDFQRAREALRNLSGEELILARNALTAAGFATEDLTVDLADLVRQTRENTREFQAFAQLWKDLEREEIDLSNLREQVEFLRGGGDTNRLFLIDAAARARDALRKLDAEGLSVIRQKLADIGFAADTAQEALTRFFATKDQAQQLVNVLSRMQNELRDIQERNQDLRDTIAGFNVNAATGEAMERMVRYRAQLREFAREMEAAGVPAEEMRQRLEEMATAMMQGDQLEQELQRTREIAQAWRDVWVNAAESAVDGFIDVIMGQRSVGDALQQWGTDFLKNILKTQLDEMLQGFMQVISGEGGVLGSVGGLLSGILGGGAGGTPQQQLTAATSANTQATIALTFAVNMLSTAMQLRSGTSAVGGIGDFFSGLFGRATGGRVLAGSGYRIAEPGTGAEIFFPGTSGDVRRLDQLGGGGPQITIDARTTIDARGASKDAVAAMQQQLYMRDQQLRAEIPAMIDARLRDNRQRLRP